MKRFARYTLLFCLMFLFAVTTVQAQLVLAHYMPWHNSKPVSGFWGAHWTLGYFDPDTVLENGQREIASHYYPLIGPYDSNDPHALECHALLMKFAGIDGAIIDWNGIEDFFDYGFIHRSTQHFIKYLKRAGLQFSICYEDGSIGTMIKFGHLPKEEAVPHAQMVMQWLADNWFGDEDYVALNGRPVLLVFGPRYFIKKDQWSQITFGLSPQPMIYTLPGGELDGVFGWVPASFGDQWRNDHEYFYTRYADESFIAIAFPGYHDIYEESGTHASYGFVDHRDGETFAESFELALNSDSPIIQVATWNDFGEGTVIEPTREFGYRYLEFIQNRVKNDTPYGPDALRLPVRLYELKKKHQHHSARMEQLERATDLLFAGNYEEGQNLIDSVVEQYLITIDVNRDGTVNVLDLITITQHFGQSLSSDSPADINGDGIVNILDLIKVAQQFE